ncbi:MAG: type II toxin-antitoxin system PemK/MazF family toxin [Tannerella sp.]|jgi:mRNA interferase MazF|nr:type II toxin-antitoxin system PemK/MazF family toxin [Tannerella sp.]
MVSQGSIIWVDFEPQVGFEQRGRRPALVVSNDSFNRMSKLAVVCPITNRDKHHPFHVRLNSVKTSGVILCDQVRTMDIVARNYEYIETAPDDILFEVTDIINSFIEI